MLSKQKHEQILKNILKDIYTSSNLQARLVFKGGTCLYMFYDLDRFSVDLDFNVISSDFDDKQITDILTKYLSLTDKFQKHFTWLWFGSYQKGMQGVKVEISKRDFPDTYVNKNFYGITVPTLSPDCIFAHKLCAISDRSKMQNRDLYDAHFMFAKDFPINEEIIKVRTGKTLKEYFLYLIDFIEKNTKSNKILEGLGELLSDSQKDRVRETLLRDILFDLKSRTR